MKKRLLGFAVLLSLLVTSGVFGCTDPDYVGINNATGYWPYTDYLNQCIAYDLELGVGFVRMGIDGLPSHVAGYQIPDEKFEARDRAVNAYLANGIQIRACIDPRAHVQRNGSIDQEAVKENYRDFCRQVLTRYQGKISYYISINEPDIGDGNDKVEPRTAVEYSKILYETAKEIDPNIMVESPPVNSPESEFLRSMLDLGITNYCDYVGVHAYGAQIDEHRFGKPWEWMQASGGIQKPINLSECGVDTGWCKYNDQSAASKEEWARRWYAQFYVAAKRFGYSSVMIYTLDSPYNPPYSFNLLKGPKLANGQDPFKNPPELERMPSFLEIRDHYQKNTFTNGGFERQTDFEREWVFYHSADDKENYKRNVEILTDNAVNAHAGAGYCRMDTSGGGYTMLRQIADGLTPGKTYTVRGYVYVNGGTTAALRALGYDKTAGNQSTQQFSSLKNQWEKVSFDITPTNSWAVIDLYAAGGGNGAFVKWDDIKISEKGTFDDVWIEEDGDLLRASVEVVRISGKPRKRGTLYLAVFDENNCLISCENLAVDSNHISLDGGSMASGIFSVEMKRPEGAAVAKAFLFSSDLKPLNAPEILNLDAEG